MNTEYLTALKEACAGAVAKSGDGVYLPLWMHMADTAGVMEKIFDERVSGREKALMGAEEAEAENVKRFFVLAGILHDLGKMTSVFQSLIQSHLKNYHLFHEALLPPDRYGEHPKRRHNLSGMDIALWLGYSKGTASLIGAHHGKTPVMNKNIVDEDWELTNQRILYGFKDERTFWQDCWKSISASALEIAGFSAPDQVPQFSTVNLFMISGYLVMADWIASNTTYFPLIKETDSGNVKDYPNRVETGWSEIDLTKRLNFPTRKMSDEVFEGMFGFRPNRVQQEIMKIVNHCQEPGIFIIEAPMGLGKTEAALMAADVLAGESRSSGLFFGLPTQATVNGLFPRFEKWSEQESAGGTQSITLAHGKASLNDDYQKIPKGTASVGEDKEDSLVVHDWMQGRKLKMLSDFVIGTVDQCLMGGLNANHVMLRHIGFSGKVVIMDEVHAYDQYMDVFFDRMINWLGAYHVPLILLSATLPSKRRNEMIQAYLTGKGAPKKAIQEELKSVVEDPGYPSIVYTDGNRIIRRNIRADVPEKQIRIQKVMIDVEQESDFVRDEEEKIAQILRKDLMDGGCACVILNTVARAQKIGQYLESNLRDYRVIIFHSRFTSLRRSEIEKLVLKSNGKNSTHEDRNGLVVVGTQVMEQSLDVDFDVMITELAPMDLLLQRMGRLQRHERNRPDSFLEPTLYVIDREGESFDKSVKKIYDDWVLYRTRKNLPDTVNIPPDIPILVEKTYDEPVDGRKADSPLEAEYYKAMVNDRDAKLNKAKFNCIVSPPFKGIKNKSLNAIMDAPSVKTEEKAQSSVRLSSPSIQVILLKRNNQGFYTGVDEDAHWKIKEGQKLTSKDIKDLLSEQITLPMTVPFDKALDELDERNASFKEWKKNPMLSGLFFLVLDDRDETDLAGVTLYYDQNLGLMTQSKQA